MVCPLELIWRKMNLRLNLRNIRIALALLEFWNLLKSFRKILLSAGIGTGNFDDDRNEIDDTICSLAMGY